MRLPIEARQILLELEMIAAGPAQSFDKEGGRSSERSARPAGDSDRHDAIPHLHWGRLMVREPHRLAERIVGAREHLERLLRAPERVEVKPEDRGDMEKRALKSGEGFPVHMVLVNFPDLTHKQLVALRASNGRSVETGYLLREHVEDPEDELQRALTMRRQGMSYRQVQMLTGVKRSTLCDAEKRAA